jgi:hypothetical protein
MRDAVERVMKTYGMLENLTPEQYEAARERVTSHLSENPETDENALAIEGLRYLRTAKPASRRRPSV